MKNPLSKAKFNTWLTQKAANPNIVIGEACNSSDCPISNCIKDITKKNDVVVGTNSLWISFTEVSLTKWQYNFVLKVDQYASSSGGSIDITAGKALEVLSEV